VDRDDIIVTQPGSDFVVVYFKPRGRPYIVAKATPVGTQHFRRRAWQTARAAYLTVQAVPVKYGRNRKELPQDVHEAMLAFLEKHKPATAELQGSIVAI
jgi:hypothetical protein